MIPLDDARCRVLVGMRGAGKTTLGRAYADQIGWRFADSDAEFIRRHGPIARYIDEQGWPAFRIIEEEIIAELVAEQTVLAVGGGAVESAATRELLQRSALTLFIDEEAAVLVSRLQEGTPTRPPLTDEPLAVEVRQVLARRHPLYSSVAQHTLPAGESLEARLERLRA